MIPHVVMHLFLELVELAHEIDLYRGQHDANRIHTPIKEGVVIRVSSMARRDGYLPFIAIIKTFFYRNFLIFKAVVNPQSTYSGKRLSR